MKEESQRFKKLKKNYSRLPRYIFLLFLFFSLVLSISIILRIFFTLHTFFRLFSIISYSALFFILPILSLLYLINEFDNRKNRILLIYFSFLFIVQSILLLIAIRFSPYSIPEYLVLWYPVPLMLMAYAKMTPESKIRRKKYITLVVSGIILAILLPNLTVAVGESLLINQTSKISDNSEKASYICSRVEGMNVFGAPFRANSDYWEFMLTGVGLCGETSVAKSTLLSKIGFDSRRVVLSGENHEVMEVYVDGDWKVGDGPSIMTRADLTDKRIRTIGSLTYVVTLTEDSFIELTQQYVENADWITIIVTKDGLPVVDAEVKLQHSFVMESGSIMQYLPHPDRSFITDNNGTVSFFLGKPVYIDEFEESEDFIGFMLMVKINLKRFQAQEQV